MRILGMDTSCKPTGIALFSCGEISEDGKFSNSEINNYLNSGKMEAISVVENDRSRAESILPMIEEMLSEADISFSEIDGIAVGIGPGSFTGIRIGVTVAKTMAQFSNKKIYGISTLNALAYGWNKSNFLICPVIDARADRIFAASYIEEDYELVEVIKEDLYFEKTLIPLLIDAVEKYNKEGIFFVGEGIELHNNLKDSSNYYYEVAEGVNSKSPVEQMCKLSVKKSCRGEFDSELDLKPNYLRKSQAEMDRDKNGKKSCR